MSGTELETEAKLVMERLGWRPNFQGEKAPALDYLFIYPDREKVRGTRSPEMTVAFQVKSRQQPASSAIGLQNLGILQQHQIPVFWYCISPTRGQNSRRVYYLSPEWLSGALKSLVTKKRSIRRTVLPSVSLENPLSNPRAQQALQRFIEAWYESFLERLGEAAVAPLLGIEESSAGWAKHIATTFQRFYGLRPRKDLEVSLDLAKRYRQARQYDEAEEQLEEAERLLSAVSKDDPLRSRYWYERAYKALNQDDYPSARRYAIRSGTDGLRRSIAQAVTAQSYYLPVLVSQRPALGYRRNVVLRLDQALEQLEKVRPTQADRWLKDRWVANILVTRAEAHAVYSLLSGGAIGAGVLRGFARARRYWFQKRLMIGIASCLFVDALLARLRNDRSGFDLASMYFTGTMEVDSAPLQAQFLDNLRKHWT